MFKLNNLLFDKISDRKYFLNALKVVFKNAPGDTERPINEVDLWDWSSIVAALYKSALAGALLGKEPKPNKLKWRLLAIRVNSEKVWGNSSKIPVLLARKDWTIKGLINAKKLLEEDYPLGNEVYRDENGSIFVVPDIQDLLKMRDSKKNKTLEEMISEALGYEGEIVVTPAIEKAWCAQNPSGRPDPTKDEIPPIGQILSEKPHSPPDAIALKQWWDAAHGNPEVCTISWLRPQGPTKKGFNRKASDHWAEKVTGRAEEWLRNRHDTTIWMDEATDTNGRICLITGKLDISDWLKPDGHIKTLLVKPPDASNKAEPKTPSFARIRRVWTTTKTFWDDVTRDLHESIGPATHRLKITGNNSGKPLTKFSAYEAELDGVRFSIFYAGDDEYIIIDNLQRLAEKMDVTVERLKAHIAGKTKTLHIYDSEGKNREKPIGHLEAPQLEPEATSYLPAIPILSEPSIFMAIVPADKALNVANHIKEKYEKEMGKVRNRLPLTLGLVFARSHTPLAALMDAGRRMLQQSHEEEDWTLHTDADDCGAECILNFTNRQKWHIPVKMGDGTTDDIWSFVLSKDCPLRDNLRTFFDLYGGLESNKLNLRFGCWVCTVVRRDRALSFLSLRDYRYKVLLRFKEKLRSMSTNGELRELRTKGRWKYGKLNKRGRLRVISMLHELLVNEHGFGLEAYTSHEVFYLKLRSWIHNLLKESPSMHNILY